MNIEYYFLVLSDNDRLIQRSIITSLLSYNQLMDLLYTRFRNFNKYYSDEVNSSNVDKYILNSIADSYATSNKEKDAEYFVYMTIENSVVNITVSNRTNNFIYAYRQVVINDKYAGNCVTDFINRGIQPITAEITKFYEDINNRHVRRMQEINYHDSDIYEKDYTQILKIKELAQKMLILCNKELQQLCDKYTK